MVRSGQYYAMICITAARLIAITSQIRNQNIGGGNTRLPFTNDDRGIIRCAKWKLKNSHINAAAEYIYARPD